MGKSRLRDSSRGKCKDPEQFPHLPLGPGSPSPGSLPGCVQSPPEVCVHIPGVDRTMGVSVLRAVCVSEQGSLRLWAGCSLRPCECVSESPVNTCVQSGGSARDLQGRSSAYVCVCVCICEHTCTQVYRFLFLFNKCFFSAFYLPDTVLSTLPY